MGNVSAFEWLTFFAILFGPIFAVQTQKFLENFKAQRDRKQRLFNTLMGTRRARLAFAHVEALNAIDIEFYGTKIFRWHWQTTQERAVTLAWKTYLDQLNEHVDPEQLSAWNVRCDELFTDLMFELARSLGYEFDKVHLKRSIYSPRGHADEENTNREIREEIRNILTGDGTFPIRLIIPDDAAAMQGDLQKAILGHMNGTTAVKVEIVNPKTSAAAPQ